MTTTVTSTDERERQRFEHLVLGRARPKLSSRRKGRKVGPTLAPDVDQQLALRERWSHKQGTPQTHEHVLAVVSRPGCLARLCETGAISPDQLAAAEEIVAAHETLTADVRVRTAKLERVDGSRRNLDGEAVARVRADRAYSWWRREVGAHGSAMLAMIVDDVGLVVAAREYRMSARRARRLLGEALDLWWRAKREG